MNGIVQGVEVGLTLLVLWQLWVMRRERRRAVARAEGAAEEAIQEVKEAGERVLKGVARLEERLRRVEEEVFGE